MGDKLQEAIKQIEKEHGKGSIMCLSDIEIEPIDFISTSSILLNKALGIGGIPKGRITEIYGNEMSGKTTLCLHIIAECQKLGGKVAFIDAEHALDLDYVKKLDVQPESMLISQPDSGEQALNITETLVRSEEVDLIIIDSVAALTPRAEIEGEMGQSHMGLQARLMSQALRKLTGIASKSNTAIIFTNQIRSKIGVVFGNPEVTTGGNALKFYSSVRISMTKFGPPIKEKDVVVGSSIRVKIVKNKVAAPFRQVELQLCYGIGFDSNQELLEILISEEIFVKAGAWYKYGEQQFQGGIKAKEYVKQHYDELLAKIKAPEGA